MRLGAHMSIAGGVDKAIQRGASIDCQTIQIFVKSPNRWAARRLPPDEIERFQKARDETGIHPIFAHDSYLVNAASPDPALWKKSLASLEEELDHCEALELPFLVMHPGSHRDEGVEAGLDAIAKALDELHARKPGYKVRILLETTAGQGAVLGSTFEQLRGIIDRVKAPERLGVCLDTCHVFAAGYELRTADGYKETMQKLDEVIGVDRVLAFHLNDSKGDLGSNLDRHEQIGEGKLGLEAFRLLLNDHRWSDRPMVLETEKSEDLHEDVENLRRLRGLIGDAA